MKTKHLFLTAILLVFSVLVVAGPVDPARALKVAEQFAPQPAKAKRIKSKTTPEQSYEIVYTHRMPNSDRAAFYVVKLGEKGFVIISADDVANPILGYSYTNSWPTSVSAEGDTILPPQVLSYLNDMALQIETAIEKYPNLESSDEWNNVGQKAVRKAPARRSADALPDSVGPLLTTTWGQGQYYNALCPEDAEGEDGHVQTGCVATAMAQIINYWGQKEEIKTRGIHSYDSQYGNLRVNYDSTSYDFANMPDALTAESTPKQINAVAKLMYECGVAVSMQYRAGESGAYNEDVRGALISYYGFSSTLGLANRQLYTNIEWKDSLRVNILRGEPIYYNGNDVFAGHAFVLDGYTYDDYFHFNFGWNGFADGWYLIDAINPSYEFNDWQTAIMGIRPETYQHSVICHRKLHAQNIDYFTIKDPINLYPLRGGSLYNDINEWSGTRITLNLQPEDTTDQVVLDVLKFDNEQSVAIYDGINKDSLIRVIETRKYGTWEYEQKNWFYEGGLYDTIFQKIASADFSPIVSTRHGLTVVAYQYGEVAESFHLRVSKASDCRMISNVKVYEDAEGYYISWQENGDATNWQVKVGDNIYASDSTHFWLAGLSPDTSYTIQIRSVCGENYSSWNSIDVNKKVYWTDLVKSEPEGYLLDGDTIRISTPKGLAWLSRCSDTAENNYRRKIISIENDLDFTGYLWKPINSWSGHIEGNSQIIQNLTISSSDNGGLFSSVFYATISNLQIINSNVNAIDATGTIAGYISDCHVSNCIALNNVIVCGNSEAGGLFGYAVNSDICNCIADGNIYSQMGLGGIVGVNKDSRLHNCVTRLGSSFTWSDLISEGSWRGLLSARVNRGVFSNCFADICMAKRNWGDSEDPEYIKLAKRAYFLGDVQEVGSIENLAVFNSTNTKGLLLADTAVNYTLADKKNVVDALNDYVKRQNDSTLRTWRWDEDLKLPVLDAFYQVTCPNVSNIQAMNIAHQDEFAVALSWEESGEAQEWQVKYKITNQHDSTSMFFITNTTIDTIEGLSLGEEYSFYVRPICDAQDTIDWNDPIVHFFEKPYWRDMVTDIPNGYYEEDGKIVISSSEGLAWLARRGSVFENETVFIVNDLDMGTYRWSPIYVYDGGIIEGGNHVISNLYCNENINDINAQNVGLFSNIRSHSIIRNVIVENGMFIGNNHVGGIFGISWWGTVINCHVINSTVVGEHSVGGLGGGANRDDASSSVIVNCSASGSVFGDTEVGGLIGYCGGIMTNCYSNCKISPIHRRTKFSNIGGTVGNAGGYISNCYTAGDIECDTNYENIAGGFCGSFQDGKACFVYAQRFPIIGKTENDCIISDTTSFNDNYLQSAITIGNGSYTNLLDALNAWVDANNSEGQYLHWGADTANVNGGYPILKQEPIALPKYIITFCNDDGTVLQQDTLELGTMPQYRGEIPTKDSTEQHNYTFIGWVQELVPVTKDVTYYAQYEATLNQYEVTFYNWDGTLLQSEWVNYGEWPAYYNSDPWRESDAQYTYTFTGWSPELSMVTGAASYTAQYEATLNQYEVIFYNWDGTLLQSEWVNYGEWPAYYNSDPWRESDAQYTYTFTGWSPELSMVTGAASYYAQYEATLNQYKVTFYNWDGSVHYSGIFNYGDWPVCSEEFGEPTKPSDAQFTYTFTGWDSELNVVTGAQSYTAQYEATLNQYEVTFYNWDGTLLQSTMVNYGEMPSYNSATPTRESDAQYTYIFIGWDSELNVVTGVQSYTAQYEATLNQYEITFYDWDGSLLYSEMFDYGEYPVYGEPANPERESNAQFTYTFTGWDSELNVVTGVQSYTAQYESTLNQYEITFYNWDGTLLQSTMVNYGEMPLYTGATPTREADAQFTYTFIGWDSELNVVTGVQSYTAQYEATLNQYEVTFYNWDGSIHYSGIFNYGDWPVCSEEFGEPTRPSDAQYTYTFTGWGDMSIVTRAQSYTAQYEATLNQYEITFYNWDGTLLQSTMVNYGEMPIYNSATPTREADVQYTYIFTGWDSELNVVTGVQSYTAQYEATLNQYEVTFDNWDGTLLQSIMVNYGEMPVYTGVTPTREADAQFTYTFIGWDSELNVVTGAQSYTAQYEATLNQYEVTFYNWDGTLLQSELVNYGEMPVYTGVTPTREADAQFTYTFIGWDSELNVVTGVQSYTAQYESTLNQYEITFYNWDGTLLQSTMVNYGEMPLYTGATPTREADAQFTYTFIGWDNELSIVAGVQSYTAQYEATLNQYEVTFYNWDGTLLQSELVNYGEMPSYNSATPTREADAQFTYTFIGWGDMSMVTGAASYTAQYEATLNQYEVTFYNWDGTLLQSTMVNYGEMPVYNSVIPTRESDAQYTYTFTGWNPELSEVVDDQEYTAQYDAIENDPTSMDEVSAETIKPRKVLIDEKVYIIVGETIYSAQGQKIR